MTEMHSNPNKEKCILKPKEKKQRKFLDNLSNQQEMVKEALQRERK